VRSIAHQNQIAAIEIGDEVRIQWPPEMCSGKIRDAKEMRDWIRPITNQALEECIAGLRGIFAAFRWRRETLRIKLDVPDDLLGINGQRSQCNAATRGKKLIEIVSGPLRCTHTVHQPNNFLHLRMG
jgi:hypothetical protein